MAKDEGIEVLVFDHTDGDRFLKTPAGLLYPVPSSREIRQCPGLKVLHSLKQGLGIAHLRPA